MSTGATPAVRSIVQERDHHRCISCGDYVGPFGNFSIHHRQPRGMGGTRRLDVNLPANLLLLCGSGTTGCHGWIESHRTESFKKGFLVSMHAPDIAAVPVQTYCGWMRLDNTGGKTPTEVLGEL